MAGRAWPICRKYASISTRRAHLSIWPTGYRNPFTSWRAQVPSFDPTKAYDALPHLPPGGELESRAVLKACIEARAAIAELKQAGRLIPNQDVLINTIPLLEARASSEIENIVTTADQLFRF